MVSWICGGKMEDQRVLTVGITANNLGDRRSMCRITLEEPQISRVTLVFCYEAMDQKREITRKLHASAILRNFPWYFIVFRECNTKIRGNGSSNSWPCHHDAPFPPTSKCNSRLFTPCCGMVVRQNTKITWDIPVPVYCDVQCPPTSRLVINNTRHIILNMTRATKTTKKMKNDS